MDCMKKMVMKNSGPTESRSFRSVVWPHRLRRTVLRYHTFKPWKMVLFDGLFRGAKVEIKLQSGVRLCKSKRELTNFLHLERRMRAQR